MDAQEKCMYVVVVDFFLNDCGFFFEEECWMRDLIEKKKIHNQ